MTKRRGSSQVTPIKTLVQEFIQKIDQEKKIGEDELLGVWKKIVGERASRHSKPTALFRKKLKISVETSGWIQELSMNKRLILKKLQSHFGKEQILDIRFKTVDSPS